MKKRGFTLIELLAVIVILAIIALIAVSTIINIIGNAQKSAFKDSAYGIIKAGELYYTNQMMEVEGMTEEKTFTFPEAVGLEYKGSKPTGGTLKVSKEGKVALAINNGKYCIQKGYHENDMTINEDLVNCKIPSILTFAEGTSEEVILEDCIHDNNKTCENGTEVSIQVNNDTTYDFYVIKDTGNELTLIMDRNIGNKVKWNSSASNASGPLTALDYLEEQTSTWTNVPTMTYTLNDDGGDSYSAITRTDVRARMLTYTEATTLGCTGSSNSCQRSLYTNTSISNTVEAPYGYWLSSSNADNLNNAWDVDYFGSVSNNTMLVSSSFGVRPVITLSKGL